MSNIKKVCSSPFFLKKKKFIFFSLWHFSVKASIKVLNKRLFYSMQLPISGQVVNHQSFLSSLCCHFCLSPLNCQLTILTSSSDF